MMTCACFKHEPLVAIGAFHERLVAHFQIDARMAQRAAAAIAGNAGIVGFDDFRGLDRHGNTQFLRTGRIIAGKIWGARLGFRTW